MPRQMTPCHQCPNCLDPSFHELHMSVHQATPLRSLNLNSSPVQLEIQISLSNVHPHSISVILCDPYPSIPCPSRSTGRGTARIAGSSASLVETMPTNRETMLLVYPFCVIMSEYRCRKRRVSRIMSPRVDAVSLVYRVVVTS